MPPDLQQGWDAQVQFGALATFGAADTRALSARSHLSWRGERMEHEFVAKLYRSSSTTDIVRVDASGKQLLDARGQPLVDRIEQETSDRRFVSFNPRWFLTTHHYLFLLADLDMNEPAGVQHSSLRVGGVGYKLYRTGDDYISASIGIGKRRNDLVGSEAQYTSIGYFGLRIKRSLNETVSMALKLDSDLGADERVSEAEASLSWRVRGPVSITFKYGARVNGSVVNPWNTFDDGVEAAMSVNLEVEVL